MKNRLKINWQTLLLELLVVFIGVYLAFLLNNFQENQKVKNEEHKVMTSLKKELDVIGLTFDNMANYQKSKAEECDSLLRIDEIPRFYDWRYIQPQYNYAVLEYAINVQDARIVDFELYEKLVPVYREMEKLIFAENLMTEWAGKFHNMPPELDSLDVEYQKRRADNRFSAYKFTVYAYDRASIMKRLVEFSRDALAYIDKHIEPAERLAMEKELIITMVEKLDAIEDDEAWSDLMHWSNQHFTHITAEEWAAFRQEIIEEQEAAAVAEN